MARVQASFQETLKAGLRDTKREAQMRKVRTQQGQRQRYAVGTHVEMPNIRTGKSFLFGKITLYRGNGNYFITWRSGGVEEWSETLIRALLIVAGR